MDKHRQQPLPWTITLIQMCTYQLGYNSLQEQLITHTAQGSHKQIIWKDHLMSSKISWQREFVHRHSICKDHSNPDVKNHWVWTNSLLLCPNREVYPTLPGPKLSVVIRDRNCPPTLKKQKRIITLFINLDILLQGISLDKILSYVTTIWVKMLLSISAEKKHIHQI